MADETTGILREFLIREEGVRNKVYDDATGKPIGKLSLVRGFPTIGIGRELSRTGISGAEVDYLFGNDVSHVTNQAAVAWDWFASLSPPRQAAILSMVFQMGLQGVQGFPTTLGHIKQGNYAAAYDSGMRSLWAKQTPERARRVLTMLKTGVPVRR